MADTEKKPTGTRYVLEVVRQHIESNPMAPVTVRGNGWGLPDITRMGMISRAPPPDPKPPKE